MFSKDEVIENINGLIDSAGRTSGSLSAHYERRVGDVEAALAVLGYKGGYEYMGIPVHRFDIDFPGGRVSIDASDAGSECFDAIRRALGMTGLSELMPGPSLGPDGVISTRFEEI